MEDGTADSDGGKARSDSDGSGAGGVYGSSVSSTRRFGDPHEGIIIIVVIIIE